jgi:hypothetical protein
MDYQTWLETVSRQCPRAVNVRGGAYCRDPNARVKNYCDFERCPRRTD